METGKIKPTIEEFVQVLMELLRAMRSSVLKTLPKNALRWGQLLHKVLSGLF
jgi:hypothetical protein